MSRKSIAALVLLLMLLSACGKAAPADVGSQAPTPVTEQPASAVESEEPQTAREEAPPEASPEPEQLTDEAPKAIDGFFRLEELEGFGIAVTAWNDEVTLEEDGLCVRLRCNSPYVYRKDRIVAAMKQPPIQADGEWYASQDFYDRFLCGGSDQTPSLFHGTPFFAIEVMEALGGDAGSAFSEKLRDAVLLSASMGITKPHINVEKVYIMKPLMEYSAALISEARGLGIENPEEMVYGEYAVVRGAQTLRSAGLAEYVASRPELRELDPDETTVAEYEAFRRALDAQSADLSDEDRAFAEEKGITLSDLTFMNRFFSGAYREKTDDELRDALWRSYETDWSYVRAHAVNGQAEGVEPELYAFVYRFLEATAKVEWQCEDVDLREMLSKNGEAQHLDFFVARNGFFRDVRSKNERIAFEFDCAITNCRQEADRIEIAATSMVTFYYKDGPGTDTYIGDEFNITLVREDGGYKVYDVDRLWDWFNQYRDTGFDYDELFRQWTESEE